jgi:nitroreductase
MIKELVEKTRSFRRFDQSVHVNMDDLRDLVNLARLSASSANMQPLRYILSNDPKTNNLIFPALAWAGYLKNWNGPDPGEQPAAYIIILGDTRIKKTFGCDHGIAAQSIVLGATEKGLGTCMVGSVQRNSLKQNLSIEEYLDILLVIALGVPSETVLLETSRSEDDIEYWRDESGVHHVPKRPLVDLIIREYEG